MVGVADIVDRADRPDLTLASLSGHALRAAESLQGPPRGGGASA